MQAVSDAVVKRPVIRHFLIFPRRQIRRDAVIGDVAARVRYVAPVAFMDIVQPVFIYFDSTIPGRRGR